MKIVHIALGGCLRAPPVAYGLTADTGGHIAYVLGAAMAQASCEASARITVATRRFDDSRLGVIHSVRYERVLPNVDIERIGTTDRRYLEKESLAAELPEFTRRFILGLEEAPQMPSVIHAHFADAAAVALAVRERFGIPFVYTPHALALDKADRCGGSREAMRARISAEGRAIQTADALVVSSKDEAECQVTAYAVADAALRTHVIPPGVPPRAGGARMMAPLAFQDAHRPLVVGIARPTFKKNLVALAEAFAGSRLREAANLVILAGQHLAATQGAEERDVLLRLHAILEQPMQAGCVALPPRHSAADVSALYRQAARSGGIFVSPALHEPFGLTLLEAADAGLPVVATAHGGAANIVRDLGHGLVVDPRDTAAIAATCLQIIENPALHRLLSKACAGAAHLFAWERYAQRSLQLYGSLAARAGGPSAVAA